MLGLDHNLLVWHCRSPSKDQISMTYSCEFNPEAGEYQRVCRVQMPTLQRRPGRRQEHGQLHGVQERVPWTPQILHWRWMLFHDRREGRRGTDEEGPKSPRGRSARILRKRLITSISSSINRLEAYSIRESDSTSIFSMEYSKG